MTRRKILPAVVAVLLLFAAPSGFAQEARARWEKRNQIRREKFDRVLPQVMRENRIDMWITVQREGNFDPLYLELGQGYVSSIGFLIFTDRGGRRIERAALGVDGYEIENCGAYDIFGPASDLGRFVRERAPKRIGVNMSETLGGADGLSYTAYQYLAQNLDEPYNVLLVSAEKLVSDFLYRRVPAEVEVFAGAVRISRELAERALSNEVIVPGRTTLEDVAWWLKDRLDERRLESSFGLPSVYITGPSGIEATSTNRVIQRGDLLMLDWGVGLMGYYTDMKRTAYVLQTGETQPPAGVRRAFERALAAREVIFNNLKPGWSGAQTVAVLNQKLEEAGFAVMKEFDKPSTTEKTEIITGCHSVGNWGHGIGPSAAFFQKRQMEFVIRPTTFLAVEFFAYTAAPEWGGKKVRIPLEDDAVVTETGVQWLDTPIERILLIK
ncbi:MAG: M24 family metallopeptidase [Candidatus Aminicenantes bacterium]|nr:M24 family metallopeptidase [Candidatus Aminicenantes bacterium]